MSNFTRVDAYHRGEPKQGYRWIEVHLDTQSGDATVYLLERRDGTYVVDFNVRYAPGVVRSVNKNGRLATVGTMAGSGGLSHGGIVTDIRQYPRHKSLYLPESLVPVLLSDLQRLTPR